MARRSLLSAQLPQLARNRVPRRWRRSRCVVFECLEARRPLSLTTVAEPSPKVADPAYASDSLAHWVTDAAVAPPLEGSSSAATGGNEGIGTATGSDDWRSAVFNGRELGTLDFEFSRDVATVDYQATQVGVDQPRYGPERSIIENSPWSVAVSGSSATAIRIYGSGWDHDGTTPLLLVANKSQEKLVFYRGAEMTVANTVSIYQQGYTDLLNGSVPGFRYLPRGGLVHEGLVVIVAQRDRLEGGTWVPEGVSFVYTQDYGATLTRVPQVGAGFDVPAIAENVSDGIDRGREWAFSNAFPEKSVDDVLGAWFPWADYLYKSSGEPRGGQIGVFRARRPAIGEPWVVEPNKLVYERWEEGDSGGHHAHSAGMFRDGMVSFWGDEGYRNMMVRHVASDLENYTGDVWTTLEEFSGAWSPEDAKVYNYGNQAASAAPGAKFGELLVTGDEQTEVVMKIERPDEVGDKAIITNLVGSTNGRSLGSKYKGRLSLWIHHLRDRGYLVHEQSVSSDGLNTIHYSVDGELWASMTSVGGDFPVLYGDKFLQVHNGSIYAAAWPAAAMAIQPLTLNPGGTNLSNDSWAEYTAPAEGITFRAVTVSNGVYTYTDDGALVSPQPKALPPVMDQMPIWEVNSDGTNTAGGRRYLSGTDSDRSQFHWLTMWVYSLTGDGIQPSFRFGKVGTNTKTADHATRWVANSQWLPVYIHGAPSSAAPLLTDNLLWVTDGQSPAPRRWLVVGENFAQGISPPYPLQPGAAGSNELAVVDGFETADQWTVALTFGLPQVSAFSSQIDPVGSGTVRPIATLVADADDRVEVYFTKADESFGEVGGRIWIDVYADGWLVQDLVFPGVFLDKQDKVNLVISSTDTEFGATLQVMRDAYPVTSRTQVKSVSVSPSRIYFSDASQTVVSTLDWFGVQVNESTGLDAGQRADFITSDRMFRLLDAGNRPGDMDMDGDVDLDDITPFAMIAPMIRGLSNDGAYERAFTVLPELHGDIDRDGDLDFDDIQGFVDLVTSALSGGVAAAAASQPVGSGGVDPGAFAGTSAFGLDFAWEAELDLLASAAVADGSASAVVRNAGVARHDTGAAQAAVADGGPTTVDAYLPRHGRRLAGRRFSRFHSADGRAALSGQARSATDGPGGNGAENALARVVSRLGNPECRGSLLEDWA